MLQHWASEGELYIGGFVLLKFIEQVRLALNELVQLLTVGNCEPALKPARPNLQPSMRLSRSP